MRPSKGRVISWLALVALTACTSSASDVVTIASPTAFGDPDDRVQV